MDTPDGCVAISRDRIMVEKQPDRDLKSECQTWHPEMNNPTHLHMLGANQQESSVTENGLGILMDTKLTMSQQCAFVAKKTKSYPGCIRQR
ncbi:hypothetical protein HGM15179_009778 [Zosterops borbonicus]|uniref:Uncharacterized protein n=1 Tax=Zosterops borbonicus TaxID=364589 RepID=A0A8K1LKH6_9PASS|nr:hypothetical protein HGM15179_009778 [Zosterops borbonicus]